jgi:hypothetical protein
MDELTEIVDLVRGGFTLSSAAAMLGVDRRNALYRLNKLGIQVQANRATGRRLHDDCTDGLKRVAQLILIGADPETIVKTTGFTVKHFRRACQILCEGVA